MFADQSDDVYQENKQFAPAKLEKKIVALKGMPLDDRNNYNDKLAGQARNINGDPEIY